MLFNSTTSVLRKQGRTMKMQLT